MEGYSLGAGILVWNFTFHVRNSKLDSLLNRTLTDDDTVALIDHLTHGSDQKVVFVVYFYWWELTYRPMSVNSQSGGQNNKIVLHLKGLFLSGEKTAIVCPPDWELLKWVYSIGFHLFNRIHLRARILVWNSSFYVRNSTPESLLSRNTTWCDCYTHFIWHTWSTHTSEKLRGVFAV